MKTRSLEEALLALQDCLCEQVTKAAEDPDKITGHVCLCSVITGDSVPLDYCAGTCGQGRCGMAWVRLEGIQPLEGESAAPGCPQPLTAFIEMGIVRCSQTSVSGRSLPGEDDHLRETLIALEDIQIMRRAIACCELRTTVMNYTPMGPEGGCVGGTWNLLVDIT